jgi:alpha-beta hydrolase superfamily lysophospholipase
MSISFFKHFLNGLKESYKPENLGAINKDLPIAIFSGDKDPVGGNGKLVTALYNQYKNLGVKDVSIKLYPEARHEIINETNNAEVYQDILDAANKMLG